MFVKLVWVMVLFEPLVVKASYKYNIDEKSTAFDANAYKEVLDDKQCEAQLMFIEENPLLKLEFLDSSAKFPIPTLTRNIIDLGNYPQCLSIDEVINDMHIEGKYCSLRVESKDYLKLNTSLAVYDFAKKWLIDEDHKMLKLERYRNIEGLYEVLNRNDSSSLESKELFDANQMDLAVCIPKTCSLEKALSSMLFNFTKIGKYKEKYCRFSNDKPWTAADTVSVVIFSLLGLLTVLSTTYELWNKFIKGMDSKKINKHLITFSIYSNAQRLTTFKRSSGNLECIDGIRAISMAWIVLYHSYVIIPYAMLKKIDIVYWRQSLGAIWIHTANMACDTFFIVSGLLLVYTTANKYSSKSFVKMVPHFYLYRYLRFFPLLAAAILLQISFWHRISDGPIWDAVAANTDACRKYWWITLLNIQNYLHKNNGYCLKHSWYIAVDMQLYILSPLILIWIFSGKQMIAWIGLVSGILISLSAGAIFVYLSNFPYIMAAFSLSPIVKKDYFLPYYANTLARSQPFAIGLLFGYILLRLKERPLKLTWITCGLLWIITMFLLLFSIYIHYPYQSTLDFENQQLLNFINSFVRSLWALGIGLLILACVHGYGGPINWFLSHQIWKLPSRVSYAMYLFHMCLLYVVYGSFTYVVQFSNGFAIKMFIFYLAASFFVGVIMTVLIEMPFATLVQRYLGPGQVKSKDIKKKVANETPKENNEITTDRNDVPNSLEITELLKVREN